MDEAERFTNQLSQNSLITKTKAEIKKHSAFIDITKKEVLLMDSFHHLAKDKHPNIAYRNPEEVLNLIIKNKETIPEDCDPQLKLMFSQIELDSQLLEIAKDELKTLTNNKEG